MGKTIIVIVFVLFLTGFAFAEDVIIKVQLVNEQGGLITCRD